MSQPLFSYHYLLDTSHCTQVCNISRHDHLVSVLFGYLLSHSYNITFSMFLDLVQLGLDQLFDAPSYKLGAFVHWYVWANRVGNTTFDTLYSIKHCYYGTSGSTALTNRFLYALPAEGFVLLSTMIALACLTHRMFNKERLKCNPNQFRTQTQTTSRTSLSLCLL